MPETKKINIDLLINDISTAELRIFDKYSKETNDLLIENNNYFREYFQEINKIKIKILEDYYESGRRQE